MVGTSNISSLMWTRVPADNKQPHKALACVRAQQALLCCIVGRMVHLKALLHSYGWWGINRFMSHAGPLYKPGNTHQKEVPPSATYSIFYSITVHVNTWANIECVLDSTCGFDAYAIVEHSISFCNVKLKGNHPLYFHYII